MKIVILDSETVSRNDVSLDCITSLGECTVYGFTPNSEIAEKIGDADAVICNKCLITEEVFSKCPNLKYVGLFATGYNNVDTQAATRHGAVVCNVPAYSTNSVAQHTFALILNHFNKIREYADEVDGGAWVNYKLFSYFGIPTFELEGMTLGIIGYGDIGRKVAQIARAFGMNVLAYTRTPARVDENAKACSLDEVLEEECMSLSIAKMKKTAYLVNTSRGGVINERDLADALNSGRIAGAGIDVLTVEPMQESCALRDCKNCTITPHIAWAPKQTRERLLKIVAENIKCYIDGTPQNVVNG